MRRIINSTYISLDGMIERPHEWPTTGDRGSAGDKVQTELALSCDALIMGRRTYDGFAPVWPTRSGDPLSDQINSMAKYVVSSTLSEPEWTNTTVLSGDPVKEVRRLKAQPGGDIIQYGFGQLSFALMDNDLLDELRLWVHPLFVGNAEPTDLIYRACRPSTFELTDTTPLDNGIVMLSYRFTGTVSD